MKLKKSMVDFLEELDKRDEERRADRKRNYGPDDIGLRAPTDSYFVSSGEGTEEGEGEE